MTFVGLQGATQAQKDQIEQAAQVLAQDNTELACVFIQKTAVEKAIPEMDKRLATVNYTFIFIQLNVLIDTFANACFIDTVCILIGV